MPSWWRLGGQPHAWPELDANCALEQPVPDRRSWSGCRPALPWCCSRRPQGHPDELIEAARVDGANEIQIFFRIMIPYIMGTIITVTTTIIIFTLKIFDVVWVMTGGQFGTQVIATQFYRQSLHQPELGLRLGHRHRAVDRRHPGDDLQPAAVPGTGGVSMTACAKPKTAEARQRGRHHRQRASLHPAGHRLDDPDHRLASSRRSAPALKSRPRVGGRSSPTANGETVKDDHPLPSWGWTPTAS